MSQLQSLFLWATILGLVALAFLGVLKVSSTPGSDKNQMDKHLLANLQSEVDKMRRDGKRKDDELAWQRRERSNANEEGKKMNRTLTQLQGELSKTRERTRGLEAELEEAKEMSGTLTQLRGELSQTQKRTRELEEELEGWRRETMSQADQLHRQSVELKAAADESCVLKVQHSQTLELLKTRTSELNGAQAFLDRADVLSGADVMAMVANLNMEISQTAAIMVDSFQYGRRGVKTLDVTEASKHARPIIGNRMTHLLRSTDHSDDPMMIQMALQTAMLGISEWIINAWLFEKEMSNFLHALYFQLQRNEDQAVAGRWRALTRRHVRMMVGDESQSLELIVPRFVQDIGIILAIAGCKQTILRIREIIMTNFLKRLRVIGGLALRINKATWEDITSSEMEIAFLDPDTIFDSSKMDDAFGKKDMGAADGKEKILCTTELGLACGVKEEGDEGARWMGPILVKPRVLLESEMRNTEAQTVTPVRSANRR